VKKQFFHPFSSVSANGVTVCHVVTLVYVPHVSAIVLFNGWLQNTSVLITQITFCWRTMHICQNVYVSFVFPYYGCQVTLHHCLYVTPFQFMFPSKITRNSFSIWSESTTVLVYKSPNKLAEEKKIIHVQFMSQIFNLCSKSCHSCMS
jgi:hypothetical protein